MELTVGQAVYLKPIGNAARRSSEIRTDKVKSIGKKYFYVEHHNNRFFIENMSEDMGEYSSNWIAYHSEQDILDERELSENLQWIGKYYKDATLEQTRKVIEILCP